MKSRRNENRVLSMPPLQPGKVPLHVVVGAAGSDPGRRMLKDVVMGAVESAFQFGQDFMPVKWLHRKRGATIGSP
jgi:hypothetical protein